MVSEERAAAGELHHEMTAIASRHMAHMERCASYSVYNNTSRLVTEALKRPTFEVVIAHVANSRKGKIAALAANKGCCIHCMTTLRQRAGGFLPQPGYTT